MNDVIGLSHQFISHWNRRDIDAIAAALSDDVVYQNVPLPAVHGRSSVREFITPILERATQTHWVIHNFAVTSDGNKVFTERTDSFHFGEDAFHVPVMGVFEFREGLITAWRDYADVAEIMQRFAALWKRSGWNDAAGA